MSITDELRHEVADYPFRDNRDFAIFEAVADRIDAEHEAMLVDARKTVYQGYIELPKDADGEYIRIGDEMEGVDKYDSLKKVMGKVITVSFESDGIVDVAIRAWNSDGTSWRRAYLDPDASVYRHYHAPTVEDVLRQFAHVGIRIAAKHGIEAGDIDFYADEEAIAEFAARLRLAEGEEQ